MPLGAPQRVAEFMETIKKIPEQFDCECLALLASTYSTR